MADPSYFMIAPANRRSECPQFAGCLDSAQANFFDLLKKLMKEPKAGSLAIYVIKGGYVISAFVIDSDGKVTTEQGEPDYGVSRELRDLLQNSPNTFRCGVGFLNCPPGRQGYLTAVPFVDADGQYLGEVQLNVFLPVVREDSCPPQKMNPEDSGDSSEVEDDVSAGGEGLSPARNESTGPRGENEQEDDG
jgi:hypothetical protein